MWFCHNINGVCTGISFTYIGPTPIRDYVTNRCIGGVWLLCCELPLWPNFLGGCRRIFTRAHIVLDCYSDPDATPRYFAICNLVDFFLASCRHSSCHLATEIQPDCDRSTGSITFSSARHAIYRDTLFGPSSEKTFESTNSDCTCTNDRIAPNYRAEIC